jgi:hypothetical protein
MGERIHSSCSSLAPMLIPHVADYNRSFPRWDLLKEVNFIPPAAPLEWLYASPKTEAEVARRAAH